MIRTHVASRIWFLLTLNGCVEFVGIRQPDEPATASVNVRLQDSATVRRVNLHATVTPGADSEGTLRPYVDRVLTFQDITITPRLEAYDGELTYLTSFSAGLLDSLIVRPPVVSGISAPLLSAPVPRRISEEHVAVEWGEDLILGMAGLSGLPDTTRIAWLLRISSDSTGESLRISSSGLADSVTTIPRNLLDPLTGPRFSASLTAFFSVRETESPEYLSVLNLDFHLHWSVELLPEMQN